MHAPEPNKNRTLPALARTITTLLTCPYFTISTAAVIVCITILIECAFGPLSKLSILDAIVAALVHHPTSLIWMFVCIALLTAWQTIQAINELLASRYEHIRLRRLPPPTRPALEAARQYRVRLSKIEGTGAGGQITRDDVLNFISRQLFPKEHKDI